MSSEWKQVGFFAAGLAIGSVAVAMIVLGPYSPARPKPQPRPAALATSAAFLAMECPGEPVAIVAGIKDGRYRMPTDLSGYATTDPQVFIVMGNEAAAAGRAHDAEIAFLMACRVADKFKGAGSAASADARYELARHYGNLANASGATAANCGELLQRAEAMYADSLQLFRAAPQPEKARLAEQGLTGVRQLAMAQAGVVTAAPAAAEPAPDGNNGPTPAAAEQNREATFKHEPPMPRPRSVASVKPRSTKSAVVKKVASTQKRTPSKSSCAGARTRADRLICSDAELARIDREVGYLEARARNAWRYEDEWRRREASCRDRACLLRVFANKRSQLMADINSA